MKQPPVNRDLVFQLDPSRRAHDRRNVAGSPARVHTVCHDTVSHGGCRAERHQPDPQFPVLAWRETLVEAPDLFKRSPANDDVGTAAGDGVGTPQGRHDDFCVGRRPPVDDPQVVVNIHGARVHPL
jgi:hypothetical protein